MLSTMVSVKDDIEVSPKPRALFYRPHNGNGGGGYYDYLFRPKDEILGRLFELNIVHDEKSLSRALSKDQIDIVFLYMWADCDPVMYGSKVIRTLDACSLPKVMIYNTDAHSRRNWFVKYIYEMLGVTAIISCEPVLEAYHTFNVPVFYWMWSIDPSRFVQRPKEFDLFVSSRNSDRLGYYTWRCENGEMIASKFQSSLVSTCDTWALFQEKLASCRFSFTCGSSNNTVVQKHLEIPASGTCLITEETSLIRMMGFRDMVNCVFGSGKCLSEKLDCLIKQPSLLAEISNAGRQLIFDRHTHFHRNQVLQLYKLIRTGEDLRVYHQVNPFDSIVRKDEDNASATSWLSVSPPRDLVAIQRWMNSTDSDKIEHFESLSAYLRKGHPILLEAWIDWVIAQNDLPRLRTALNELVFKLDGLPDHLVFPPSFARAYARTLELSDCSRLSKRICEIGYRKIDKKRFGLFAVVYKLSAVLLGLLVLRVISIRGFLYFGKKLLSTLVKARIHGF